MRNVRNVRNVRIVRFLRFLTFLNANFYTIDKIGRRYFLFVCPKLPKMDQKILNGELNELSEFFFQCFDLILFRGAFCKFSCYGSNIVFRRTVSGLFGRKNNALIVAIKSLLPKDFLPRKGVERFEKDQFFFIH